MRAKLETGSGIYCIRCVINDRKYVGQSRHIQSRFNAHTRDLRLGKHFAKLLQSDWNLYGYDSFEFYVLCKCDPSSLNSNEQYWIDHFEPEYNRMKSTLWSATYAKPRKDNRYDVDKIDGLEENYEPKVWHRWVYGCGRK